MVITSNKEPFDLIVSQVSPTPESSYRLPTELGILAVIEKPHGWTEVRHLSNHPGECLCSTVGDIISTVWGYH